MGLYQRDFSEIFFVNIIFKYTFLDIYTRLLKLFSIFQTSILKQSKHSSFTQNLMSFLQNHKGETKFNPENNKPRFKILLLIKSYRSKQPESESIVHTQLEKFISIFATIYQTKENPTSSRFISQVKNCSFLKHRNQCKQQFKFIFAHMSSPMKQW